MKNSQKLYDSTTINNRVNKEQSITYHKKNLNLIKLRKSRINLEEEIITPKRTNNLNNFHSGK